MDGNPWTGEYRGEAAPKDIPNRTLIGWAYACWCDYNSSIAAWLLKDAGERCGVRLKTMEKIDEGKNKKHTGKRTDNPKDRTLYITCQMWQAQACGCAQSVRNKTPMFPPPWVLSMDRISNLGSRISRTKCVWAPLAMMSRHSIIVWRSCNAVTCIYLS